MTALVLVSLHSVGGHSAGAYLNGRSQLKPQQGLASQITWDVIFPPHFTQALLDGSSAGLTRISLGLQSSRWGLSIQDLSLTNLTDA